MRLDRDRIGGRWRRTGRVAGRIRIVVRSPIAGTISGKHRAEEMAQRDSVDSEARLASDQNGAIGRQLVPVQARTEVMLEVMIVMEQPPAQPSWQDKLPRVAVAPGRQVEVLGDDPDVLHQNHHGHRQEPRAVTIPAWQEENQRRDQNRHAAHLEQVAGQLPASKVFEHISMNEQHINRRAEEKHPARVERGVGIIRAIGGLVVFPVKRAIGRERREECPAGEIAGQLIEPYRLCQEKVACLVNQSRQYEEAHARERGQPCDEGIPVAVRELPACPNHDREMDANPEARP